MSKNVSRLKLYLPRQKWTMNETLIFFKIRAVLKKYWDWICIYLEGNEQWMKRWFSSKYELYWKWIDTEAVFTKTEMNNERNVNFLQNNALCWKSIETEAVFTKTGINNEWNVHFLRNDLGGIQQLYSSEAFYWSNHTWNTLFG